jgi:hypothetical protein
MNDRLADYLHATGRDHAQHHSASSCPVVVPTVRTSRPSSGIDHLLHMHTRLQQDFADIDTRRPRNDCLHGSS